MAEVNVELGLTTEFFNTWELFGGYKYYPDTDKHLLIIKQKKDEEKKQGRLNCKKFLDELIGTINNLAKKQSDANDPDERALKEKVNNLPEDLNKVLQSFEVYVEEVYLRVEITVPQDPDADKPTETEYAFWAGIKMTDEINKALDIANENKIPYLLTEESCKKLENLSGLVGKFADNGSANLKMMKGKWYDDKDDFLNDFKTARILKDDADFEGNKEDIARNAEYPLPALFKIFQLKDLYFKIWKTDRREILKEMQLDLFERFALPPPETVQPASASSQAE